MTQDLIFSSLAEPLRRIMVETGILSPTPPQSEAIPHILKGENVLVIAPTGSGKTEAALLPALSRMLKLGMGEGISILYITPLRALNRDMLRRLELWASRLNLRMEIRHGDTPPSERRRQSEKPPHLLVTTPETLQAVLPGSRMRRHLASVKTVIVDEVHGILKSKRGVQLCVGLERLRDVAGEFQVVGLSATVADPDLAADFIFGVGRARRIVKPEAYKASTYSILYPTPTEDDATLSEASFTTPEVAARLNTISELIDSHESVLIFVNSRTVAEMLGEKLGRLRNDVAVHHSSLPREERERVESEFKTGRLKAIICTSTLELGIDVGSVDLVIQYMSPRQVSALIQRVGRSGHSLTRSSEGMMICVSADDILESSAAIEQALARRLEPLKPYENSLDVLAHQTAGILMDRTESIDGKNLLQMVRRTYPYRGLSDEAFWRVADYLARLGKLRIEGSTLRRTRQTREYYFQNLSMIPDEVRYLVVDVTSNRTVGILGEEFMLLKARVGLHFICKGKVWQIESIADDRKVYVTPADDPLAAIPGWDGEMLPVPFELAQRSGELRAAVSSLLDGRSVDEAVELSRDLIPAEKAARRRVVEEIDEHRRMGAPLPTHNLILLEGYGKYLVVHACFGESVNRTLAYTFEEILSRKGLIRLWWMDGYRILMELTVDTEELDLSRLATDLLHLKSHEAEEIYQIAVQRNFPFPSRVKNVAERFGALKRGQYVSHPNLCSLPTRFESTPVYEEAMQEADSDLIDMNRTKEVLSAVVSGDIRVETFVAKERPTPIAFHILYRYLDLPDIAAPDTFLQSSVDRLKFFLLSTQTRLVCFQCGSVLGERSVRDIPERPSCAGCGSGLLAPIFWHTSNLGELVARKIKGERLEEGEILEVAKARRSADLVLSYGRKAITALAVYGVGPQTGSKILSKMHDDETSFYKELIEAKLKFITTRQFWA